MPPPIEVEPPWVRVDLHDNVILGAGPQHPLDVHFVAWGQVHRCMMVDLACHY